MLNCQASDNYDNDNEDDDDDDDRHRDARIDNMGVWGGGMGGGVEIRLGLKRG